MIFRVLGPLEVYEPGGERIALGAQKPAALLATLLLQANAWVRVERLIAAIWPVGVAPPSAEGNLKTYVWRLRKLLPGRLESRAGAYRITVDADELDAEVFAKLVARGDRELAAGEAQWAVETFTTAIGTWRGTPFEEIADGDTTAAAARLIELRRHAQESLARSQLAAGRRTEAITSLRALTTEDPLRESTWAVLVLALHEDGRRAEALACYQQARTLLVDELGVEPGVELAQAQQQVLAGVSASASVVPAAPDTLPRDLPDFVGRARELSSVLAAVGQDQPGRMATPVVLIAGMGGVGKTTLAVHAGHVLAERYPDGRIFLSLREESRPLDVGAALRRLLVAIGTPPEAVPPEVPDRIARWRAAIAGRRMLLVLDDVEDAAAVFPLLPGGFGSCVLMSGRGGTYGVDGMRSVVLDVLPPADAEAMFRTIAGPDRVAAEPDAVTNVVRACGNHPLALRIAAMRLRNRPLWTVAQLGARLRNPMRRIEELNRGDHGVLAAFEPAYSRLSGRARQLFDRLTTARGCIDTVAVAALIHVERGEAERLLEDLAEEYLIMECAPDRYRMHPLVRDLGRAFSHPSSSVDHAEAAIA